MSTAPTTEQDTDTDTPSAVRPRLLRRQLAAALRLLLVLTVILGVVYPLGIWALSRLPGLHDAAEGSLVGAPGAPTGSSLIGIDPVPADPAADPWFHTRPSASASSDDGQGPADPSTSGATNRAAGNEDQLAAVAARRTAIAAREGVDPHISPAYAALQIPRVARVTGLGDAQVAALVADATDGRTLGILGEPGVDVTRLDAAIAALRPGVR